MFQISSPKGISQLVKAGTPIKLEYVWGWTQDDGPGEHFEVKHVPERDTTVEECLPILHGIYEEECQERNETPRHYYYEGISLGRDVIMVILGT